MNRILGDAVKAVRVFVVGCLVLLISSCAVNYAYKDLSADEKVKYDHVKVFEHGRGLRFLKYGEVTGKVCLRSNSDRKISHAKTHHALKVSAVRAGYDAVYNVECRVDGTVDYVHNCFAKSVCTGLGVKYRMPLTRRLGGTMAKDKKCIDYDGYVHTKFVNPKEFCELLPDRCSEGAESMYTIHCEHEDQDECNKQGLWVDKDPAFSFLAGFTYSNSSKTRKEVNDKFVMEACAWNFVESPENKSE